MATSGTVPAAVAEETSCWRGNETAVEELPGDLTIEHHALLHGRERHPVYRRGLFAVICVLPVLALLNVFGQHATSQTVHGTGATLEVEAAKNLRGGLLHQLRLTAVATRDMEHPQFVLSPGWFEQNTENSIAPDPLEQSSSNGRVVLSYGPLKAGQKLTVWIDFQVNPVNVGRRTVNVELTDGPRSVAFVKRNLTVFP
jgi:hypothetical protein